MQIGDGRADGASQKIVTKMTAKEFRDRGIEIRGAKSKKPRKQDEHEQQSLFFSILELNTRQYPELKFIFAVPNAARRSPQLAAMMLREGLKAGIPDIIVPIPKRGFHGAFIENKSANGKMSESQIRFRDFLISQGYAYKTTYSADEQIEFLEWFLGIELNK